MSLRKTKKALTPAAPGQQKVLGRVKAAKSHAACLYYTCSPFSQRPWRQNPLFCLAHNRHNKTCSGTGPSTSRIYCTPHPHSPRPTSAPSRRKTNLLNTPQQESTAYCPVTRSCPSQRNGAPNSSQSNQRTKLAGRSIKPIKSSDNQSQRIASESD